MRILICNDDGIYAPGIQCLHEAVKDLGEVQVVAPISEQSAVGHAITLSNPIKTQPVQRNGAFFGHGVGGTPADCVKLAVFALLEKKPDIILSGINLGANEGISVIYSGTVSAATEGTILGIPSVAFSLCTFQKPQWDTAAKVARAVTQQVLRDGLPKETLLNVNIPNVPWAELKGHRVTRMGRSRFAEIFHRRQDPRGNVYYWMDGYLEETADIGGTDLEALAASYVSLTPIWFDLTNYRELDGFRAAWSPERFQV